ncbi:hypothetical protein [Candidatus Ruthturnera calyptogenae]|uniref:hypothetical protein n=1 Tax=Candidatus Ruthturnera calyptogenae TaxID=386487 RepID=UPI0002D9B030|nr:hypothetical protein [Candidatus Ruthturnera calyptogenae]
MEVLTIVSDLLTGITWQTPLPCPILFYQVMWLVNTNFIAIKVAVNTNDGHLITLETSVKNLEDNGGIVTNFDNINNALTRLW